MNEKRYSVNCGSRSVNARILEVRENGFNGKGRYNDPVRDGVSTYPVFPRTQ